jgi:uncharacterized protein DUF5648
MEVDLYSGYPSDAMTKNLATVVTGNLIRITGSYVECDGTAPCSSGGFGEGPPYLFKTYLPILAPGTYTIEVRLSADPSYPRTPPPVETGAGPVQAGVFVNAAITVVSGTASEMLPVVEYYNSTLNHYFMTPLANEIALLDAREPPFQDWARTGYSFKGFVAGTAPASTVHICRFYNAAYSSHFYGTEGYVCGTTLSSFRDWTLETLELMNEGMPSDAGVCAIGTQSVYRLYNNGMGGAPNHRFLTDLNERQHMIDIGWIPEGYGMGVTMCAPQ